MFSSAAQDHDIKGKTTTFEAEHKECIRVLPYTSASGQVYVQLYVFCGKNGIPEELKKAAQEFFGETGVELKWTNLYNHASNMPNIVSKDFKQLEVSQANVISKIINKNLPVFSKHRNITAIQPSLKVTNSKQTNDPCIRVYVLGKGCIPVGESEIPHAVENCLVDIVDGFWLETLDTPMPLTAHKQEGYLRLGASIGVRGTKSAGTLGAIVKDDSKFYLLSCDHVINHEWEKEIIHPGGAHYLSSLKYHLIEYQNWINRIIKPENRLKHLNPTPESIFKHLQNQVDSFYNAPDVQRHPKLEECKRKLDELFSEKPRTVAYYTDGIRKNMTLSNGLECFVDAAIAELTVKEVEALKENGYVEIIDTTNYPDGDVSRDGSPNQVKEWCKSGSSTGYTTLESYFSLKKVFLKTAEHERPSFFPGNLEPPETYASDDGWLIDCLFFPHNQNVFSNLGDSGAVIFEKSDGQPQAMSGFGIVLGVIISETECGTVAAPLLSALNLLSEKLGRRLTLVSTF